MTEFDFTDRVAVVTGAGGGLGRSHALALAARGAKVVVNDLGGNPDGTGSGSSMADQVVKEIESSGGEAVANYDGVHTWEGGQAIIKTALDTWGRVDIVVNNAGILRDASFAKLTPEQYGAVVDVHLKGTVCVSKAAWEPMRERGYGRIVNTASGAGLYGNFGQANYAAAKMGIVGFTRVLAVEGAKNGITANVIAPFAASRLTEDILPKPFLDRLSPDYVATLVTILASEAFTGTGGIYAAGGGYYSRVAIVEGKGLAFHEVPTAEELYAQFADLTNLGETAEPENVEAATRLFLARLGLL